MEETGGARSILVKKEVQNGQTEGAGSHVICRLETFCKADPLCVLQEGKGIYLSYTDKSIKSMEKIKIRDGEFVWLSFGGV